MIQSDQIFPKLDSIARISKIPVVETGVQYATSMYHRIKATNTLITWSLENVEGGIQIALSTSFIAVPIIKKPLVLVDNIVCKSLDTVEHRVPAINYPPERLLNMTKDIVALRLVQPVLKRADSMKNFGICGASKYGDLAATRLDKALNVADEYVEKYLPDAMDTVDANEPDTEESKAIQTIHHVNRLSRKLKRRLTKRTIYEAQALKKQSENVAQFVGYLLELLVKDPKQFAQKMKQIWLHFSEDEPENQIPPANLEQLITMLTREMARRFVHVTNYSVSIVANLPNTSGRALHITNHHLSIILDNIIKKAHLEGAKALAVAKAEAELTKIQFRLQQILDHVLLLLENSGSKPKMVRKIEAKPKLESGSDPEKLHCNGEYTD